MTKRDYNRECLVICKKCGTVNQAAWKRTLLAWNGKWDMHHCSKCNSRIHLDTLAVMVCPHCGTVVEKNPTNECLKCHRIMYREGDYFKAVCKNCSVTNLIPLRNSAGWKCSICDKPFDPNQLVLPEPQIAEPLNIKLKTPQQMAAEDLIVWKNPMNEFPYRSRLMVSEGTWALLLQNGVCQYPYGPGSYLLEESKLSTAQKLAQGDSEDLVYNTDIFCVVKTLPSALFGVRVEALQNTDKTKDYICKANGSLTWNVTDAKAFAEKIGYKEAKGKSELFLISDDPTGTPDDDGMILRETRQMAEAALETCLRNIIGLENLDPEKLNYRKADVEKQLQAELDRRADAFGLSVGSLKLTTLDVSLNTDTKRRETIHLAAQKEYQWTTNNPAKVYVPGSDSLFADYTLDGSVRCRISDQEKLDNLQEIRTMADDSKAAEDYFRSRISEVITSVAGLAAQDLVDQQEIGVRELSRRKNDFANSIVAQSNSKLIAYGIQIEYLNILNSNFVESPDLKKQAERADREKKFIAHAEKKINWCAKEFKVHKKDEPALSAGVTLRGDCTLKVTDEKRFFANSKVNEFIEKNSFPTEQEVNDYYREEIQSCIFSTLANYTQKMIDRADCDITTLERYTKELEAEIKSALENHIKNWGMNVESVFLTNSDVKLSDALKRAEESEKKKAEFKYTKEDKKAEADLAVFTAQTDAERDNAIDDANTGRYIHARGNEDQRADADAGKEINKIKREDQLDDIKHTSNMNKQARSTEEIVGGIQGKGQIDAASDEINKQKQERKYDDERRTADHDREIAERKEETKRIIAQIQREAYLDDAKFKETLVGILHRIDASNLDWQKKLDEYTRLSKNLGFEDWVNEQRTLAETGAYRMRTVAKAKIDNTRDEGQMELGLQKEEADLVETINRYAEERNERIAQAEYERYERETILDFQQTMEMKRQQFEHDMAALKEELAENQRIREQENTIAELQSKLWMTQLNLEAQVSEMALATDSEIAKTTAEKAVRIAEAAYKAKHEAQEQAAADRREREAQQRQDSLDQRAEDLLKRVMDMQEKMDQARVDLQTHLDDNASQVEQAKATSNSDQLLQKIQELTQSVKDTKQSEISQRLDRLGDVIAKGGNGSRLNDETKELTKTLETIRKELQRISDGVKEAVKKKCPRCGSPVGKNDKFCTNCGASLLGKASGNMIKCNNCGKFNPSDSSECQFCSNPL